MISEGSCNISVIHNNTRPEEDLEKKVNHDLGNITIRHKDDSSRLIVETTEFMGSEEIEIEAEPDRT